MHLTEKIPGCTCNESVETLDVKTKSANENQNTHCISGSNLKKVYHSPVLKVYGTLTDLVHFEVDSRKI
jgi:hypothetical protein